MGPNPSAKQAGLVATLGAGLGYLLSPPASRLVCRLGCKTIVVGSSAATLRLLPSTTSLSVIVAVSILLNSDMTLLPASVPVFERVREARPGKVAGANVLVRNLGHATTTALLSLVLRLHTDFYNR